MNLRHCSTERRAATEFHPWLEFGCGSPLCTTMTKIHAFLTRSYACNSRTCLQGGRFYHRHSIIFPAYPPSTIHYPLSTSVAALPRWVLRVSAVKVARPDT